MATGKTSKQELIASASELFRLKGYHNTSMSDIASACHISKASLYHHFVSKKDLTVAVLQNLRRYFAESIFVIAYEKDRSGEDRLHELMDKVENFFVGRKRGCLMGNLVLEVIDLVPEFQPELRGFFQDWMDALTVCLQEKLGHEKAKELAADILSQMQGALMLANLYQDDAHIRRVHAVLCRTFAIAADTSEVEA